MSAAPALAADPMLPAPWRVTARRDETADTLSFDLEPVGEAACRFAPGQFNMIYLFGRGEVPISISGNAAAPERLVHTVRRVGRVTDGFAGLAPGDVVGLRGPFGTGWPMRACTGRDVLVIAGGLGLAPVRPAIYHLLQNRPRFRRVTVLYGARSPGDLLYPRELLSWSTRPDVAVAVTVDRAGPDWQGRVGVITPLVEEAAIDPANAVALVCGPGVMMGFVTEALARRGVPASAVHLTLERNMKCAIAHCGHCQLGPHFVCKDGPVLSYDRVRGLLAVREL